MERRAKDGTFYKQVGEDEWQPVTRVAKNGTTYAKVGQDEWRPVGEERAAPKSSMLETAVKQGLSAAIGNFGDEVGGVAEAAGRAVGIDNWEKDFKDWKLNPNGPTLDREELGNAYRKGRDASRAEYAQQAKDHPVTAAASQFAGAVLSPVNKLAKGASIVKAGAGLGGLNALGMSEGETAGELLADTSVGAATGAGVGKGLQWAQSAIGKAFTGLARVSSPARRKQDAELIIKAAERQGLKVTPGMLDDTGFVERLESVLARSPSILGQSVKRKQEAVVNRLREAGEETLEGATNLSPAQLGDKFKSGVSGRIHERLDPVQQVFNDVAESTKSMELSERSLNAVRRNIGNLDLVRLTGGGGKGGEYMQMIGRMKTPNDVKTVMTMLNTDIRAAQGAERQVLIGIKDKLSALETNSITRSAIQAAKEGRMRPETGKAIGKEIVTDLRQARTEYRGIMDDLKQVGETARVKGKSGPMSVLDEIEAIPSEQIADRFLRLDNNRQMQAIANKFPDEYALLKAGKLREIADKAIDTSQGGQGAHNTTRFLREVSKLNPEAKTALFGRHARTIDDLALLNQNLPRNFNPSGTASEQGWMTPIVTNAKDVPLYMLYRAASGNLGRNIADNLMKAPSLQRIAEKNPNALQNVVQRLEREAGFISSAKSLAPAATAEDKSAPKTEFAFRGQQKWTLDGLSKLAAHAEKTKADFDFIDRVMDLKGGKGMLIHAADLKPGSPAMDKLFQKAKTAAAKGGSDE